MNTPSSFGRLRACADVLRLAAATPAPLRPFAVELFRGQTELNHRVVDVLEDALWLWPLPDRAARIEARLGPYVTPEGAVVNARGGLAGQLIVWSKQLGLAGLEVALADARRAMTQANRGLVDALKAQAPFAAGRLPAPAFEPWFAAQSEFYAEVGGFLAGYGRAVLDPVEAIARFAPPPGGGEARDEKLRLVPISPGVTVRLPAGETLLPHARDAFAAAFAANPELALCYGDTHFTGSGRVAFKPGWSPEYLGCTDYVGGCFAVRDRDAALPARHWVSLTERQVARIPQVLSSREAPVPDEAAPARPRPEGAPRVTLVVPFKDKVELLAGLWASLQRFDPGLPFELLLVSNQSTQRATFEFLEGLRDPRVSWFEWDLPFNWSAINNAAARRAKGDLLVFLNNDVEATHDGWLRDLAGYAAQPAIGVAGARLLYRDGSLQHGGVVIGLKGLAGHVFARWRPEYGPTAFGAPDATRNWSAVTGACQMIRRALFEELGGFDEGMQVSGGDVELCLRVRARGLRVVCVGHVALLHFESATRRRDPVPEEDLRRERQAYGALREGGDPHYHPRLSLEVGHGYPGP